jgi:small-conductance mechanosensitive channel
MKLLTTFLIMGALFPSVAFAQSPLDIISPKDLDSQAEVIKIKQDGQDSLQTQVTSLEKENTELTKQIGLLQANIADIDGIIKKDSASINLLETSPPTGKNITDEIAKLNDTISKNNSLKVEKQTIISEKEAKIEANKSAIAELKTKVKSTQSDITKEVSAFQNQIFSFVLSISRFVAIIILYWVVVQAIRLFMRKFIPNETVRNVIALILVFLAISATFITIFIAFAGNTTYLGPTIGVLSAALVVALQDFISSFFAWVVIKARGPFKIQDTIEIPTSNGLMTGIVTQIGFFRTRIKEKVGGDSPNREQLTGKTIFFPNNLILKQGFRNFTFDNKILWFPIETTVTFESNVELAQNLLEDMINKQFVYMLDHKDLYLDDVYNLKQLYKPRVYMTIGVNGPLFTIWIACRVSTFRDTLEKISFEILHKFKHHSITLAYPTTRVFRANEQEKYAYDDFNPLIS